MSRIDLIQALLNSDWPVYQLSVLSSGKIEQKYKGNKNSNMHL